MPDIVIIQVKECLKQNEELRGMLDKLRTEQINNMSPNGGKMIDDSSTTEYGKRDTGSADYTDEFLNLKVGIWHEIQSFFLFLSAGMHVSFLDFIYCPGVLLSFLV